MFRPLVLAMTFAIPICASAQVGELRNDFAIGINGGYLLNRVDFSPTIKQTWKGGETFGLTFRYTCEKYFSAYCAIQAEVNYANMGWKELIETSDDKYSRDIKYVQVPILARLAWGKTAMVFLCAGPQVGYYLSETEHRSGEWTTMNLLLRPNQVTAQYGKVVERKFDYGLTGGLGMEINTIIGHFTLEGRYYFALSDMFNNGKKDPFGRSANGAIFIKGGYLFDIIKTKIR